MNEFNRCQTQLKELYAQGVASPNRLEFACYQLMYCFFSQQHVDTNAFLRSLRASFLQSPEIQTVLRVCRALRNEDFVQFFALYETAAIPFECRHFMKQFFRRMRVVALYSLFSTYSNCGGITTRIKPSVSLAMVKSLLHFDSFEEAAEESKQFGLVFDVSRIASLSEESCKNVAIAANDGLIAMRNQQQAEKGSKLL